MWLNEYETLDDARRGIGAYVDRYHPPHSGLDYRTPAEVAQTWEEGQIPTNPRGPELSTAPGGRPTPNS